jgi:hypothetical protein
MNKRFKYLLQHRTRRKKGDTAELAAQLAPLEERKRVDAVSQGLRASQQNGAIVVDNDSLPLPKEVMEGRSGGRHFLGMEPVVLAILFVMLTFIAFIAWQISQMPVE